jgi:uncharacterized protein (DUF58 family)
MSSNYYLRARLTREGWYYLAVLSFIVGGAALCHVNLLVVLGGMMLAPLLINWRLSLAGLRGVTIRRLPLRNVPAGQLMVAEFEITNHRRWFAAWMLVVEDRWRRVADDAPPAAGSGRLAIGRWLHDWLFLAGVTKGTVFIPCVAPGETARVHYEFLFPRRGRYAVAGYRLRSCFPLGLVEAVATIRQKAELLVLPRIGRLSGEWTQRIAAVMAGEGEKELRRRASDGEFFAVRPWQSGDSTRWMHWRTTARTGRPMVRQFERESSPTVALVLDPYLPANTTACVRARYEAAISFVATALADLARRDVARVAVLVASAEHPCWIGSRSPVFLEEVLAKLAVVGSDEADHRAGVNEILAQELAGAACVLVVSSRPGSDADSPDDQHTISVASPEFATLYSLE